MSYPEAGRIEPTNPLPAMPAPASPGQPPPRFDAMDFVLAFMGGVNQGAKFRVADGSMLLSSIREPGHGVGPDMVQDALEHASRYFHPPTLRADISEDRVQQFVLLAAEVIHFMAATFPGISPKTVAYELGNAVAAVQDALRVTQSTEPVYPQDGRVRLRYNRLRA